VIRSAQAVLIEAFAEVTWVNQEVNGTVNRVFHVAFTLALDLSGSKSFAVSL
jgi:hypothetical protein